MSLKNDFNDSWLLQDQPSVVFIFHSSLPLTGMAELAGLVQRLELAVGRLESMSGSGGSSGGGSGGGKKNNHIDYSRITSLIKFKLL